MLAGDVPWWPAWIVRRVEACAQQTSTFKNLKCTYSVCVVCYMPLSRLWLLVTLRMSDVRSVLCSKCKCMSMKESGTRTLHCYCDWEVWWEAGPFPNANTSLEFGTHVWSWKESSGIKNSLGKIFDLCIVHSNLSPTWMESAHGHCSQHSVSLSADLASECR